MRICSQILEIFLITDHWNMLTHTALPFCQMQNFSSGFCCKCCLTYFVNPPFWAHKCIASSILAFICLSTRGRDQICYLAKILLLKSLKTVYQYLFLLDVLMFLLRKDLHLEEEVKIKSKRKISQHVLKKLGFPPYTIRQLTSTTAMHRQM